jgi:hypothetical protein
MTTNGTTPAAGDAVSHQLLHLEEGEWDERKKFTARIAADFLQLTDAEFDAAMLRFFETDLSSSTLYQTVDALHDLSKQLQGLANILDRAVARICDWDTDGSKKRAHGAATPATRKRPARARRG